MGSITILGAASKLVLQAINLLLNATGIFLDPELA
jgi:hypothetical protein